jgi:hypothetical protein
VALPIALAPPAHHDFVLKWRGQNTFVLPGIPTFTQWRVSNRVQG